jgi:guanosine-3',5'-bis(diphosphate) 3'-pyrophosphohydrolase
MVHTQECPHVAKLRHHPERHVPVRWAETVQGEFMVATRVEIINQRGVLAAIALAIADADANIDDINVNERDGRHYMVMLKILVKDRVHLARVMRNIRKVKAVLRISRGKSD